MFPYYIIGLFATVIASISAVFVRSGQIVNNRVPTQKLSLIAITLVTVVLAMFSGLRFKVGSDYSMYAFFYEIVDPSSLRNSLELIPQEPGFILLMMVCRSLSDDPRVFFTIVSVITVFTTLVAVRRLSVNPTFSIFLYFFLTYFTLSLNAVRQSLAVSFLLLGESYRGSSKLKWILFSALAMSFHSSAVIAFLIQISITRWRPRLISSIVILTVGAPVALALVSSGPVRGWLSTLNSRYDSYFSTDGGGIGTMLILGVRIVFIGAAFFALSRRQNALNSRYLAMVIISAMALVLGLSSWVFARLEPFFGIYLILLIPSIVSDSRHRKFFQFSVALFVLVYFGIHTFSFNGLVPYQVYSR